MTALLSACVLLFVSSSVLAQDAAPKTGSILFKVQFEGEKPTLKKFPSGNTYCDGHHPDGIAPENLLIGEKGELANAFVYVTAGHEKLSKPEASKTPIAIDQKSCQFVPRVNVIRPKQPIKLRNGDDTLHNIHSLPFDNRNEFNWAQVNKGDENVETFDKPEIGIVIKCDAHAWMRCFVHVVDNPWYGVTTADGTTKVDALPPGEYTFTVWHEMFAGKRQQTVKVKVEAGKQAEAKVVFTPPKRRTKGE